MAITYVLAFSPGIICMISTGRKQSFPLPSSQSQLHIQPISGTGGRECLMVIKHPCPNRILRQKRSQEPPPNAHQALRQKKSSQIPRSRHAQPARLAFFLSGEKQAPPSNSLGGEVDLV